MLARNDHFWNLIIVIGFCMMVGLGSTFEKAIWFGLGFYILLELIVLFKYLLEHWNDV
jgi:hypothetical protein